MRGAPHCFMSAAFAGPVLLVFVVVFTLLTSSPFSAFAAPIQLRRHANWSRIRWRLSPELSKKRAVGE